MGANDHGDGHWLGSALIHLIDPERMARTDQESGAVWTQQLLAMDRHIADAGLRVFYNRHSGRDIRPGIVFGMPHGGNFRKVCVGPNLDDLLDRGIFTFDQGRPNRMFNALDQGRD